MNAHPPRRLAVLIAPFVGFAAGLLTLPVIESPFGPFGGLPFGLFMAIYFRIAWGITARAKLFLFFVASCAASLAAFLAAFFLTERLGFSITSGPNYAVTPAPLFVGGFVGSLILLLAVYLLFCRPNWLRTASETFLGALVGGVLGIVGWHSAVLAAPLLTMFGGTPTHANRDDLGFLTLFPVWQAGMALVLAVVLAKDALPATTQQKPGQAAQTGALKRQVEARLSLPAKLFAASVVLFLGWFAARNLWDYFSQRHRNALVVQSQLEAPPMAGLPEIQPPPAEQALVLDTIEGYAPGPSRVRSFIVPTPPRLSAVEFSVMYEDPARRWGAGVQPAVMVEVTQYPTAEWAHYELRNYPGPNAGVLYPERVRTITKFGAQIFSNTECMGGETCLYWASATFRVVLRFANMPESDEFLRPYLAKYPPT